MYRILFCIILIANYAKAQIEPIATDRPDQTECSNIVPIGFWQIENGFVIENGKENSYNTKEIVFLTSLLKYGITKRFEIRLIIENSTFKSYSPQAEISKGINPIQLGFKVNLIHATKIIPETSLIAHLGWPNLASAEKKDLHFSPNFRFTMQHQLTDRAALAYNIGAELDGATGLATGIYTITTSRNLGKHLGAFIELYGFIPKLQKADNRINIGITLPINSNLMFDISASKGIKNPVFKNYISLGASFRIDTRK
jgi:hypothetical protein